jgi:hypothetical protein
VDLICLSRNRPIACETIMGLLFCLQLCMSSLSSNSIGEAGARELLAALQFNKTLAKLE